MGGTPSTLSTTTSTLLPDDDRLVVRFHFILIFYNTYSDGPSDLGPLPIEFTEKYDILEKLGHGGFGWVYKVIDKRTRVIYAAKHLDNTESNKQEVQYLITVKYVDIITRYNFKLVLIMIISCVYTN